MVVPPGDSTPASAAPAKTKAHKGTPLILAGYEMALPVGNLNDFISKGSFRGFEVGALWPVFHSLYLGPVFNYHLFYEEKGNETYPLDNGALNANLYRYTKAWTVAVAARYIFLRPESIARPFLGLRMGINFVTAATLVSDLSLYDTPTGFALAPEAGVMLRLAPFMDASLSVRYDFSTASSGELDNISYMAYQIGFVFHSGQ